MKIQILGTGCAKCQTLGAHAAEAADALGLTYELEKITDVARFAAFGVAVTPALAVDGVVKTVGKVPSVEEIKVLLK